MVTTIHYQPWIPTALLRHSTTRKLPGFAPILPTAQTLWDLIKVRSTLLQRYSKQRMDEGWFVHTCRLILRVPLTYKALQLITGAEVQLKLPVDCTMDLIPLVLPVNAFPTCHQQTKQLKLKSFVSHCHHNEPAITKRTLNTKANRILC